MSFHSTPDCWACSLCLGTPKKGHYDLLRLRFTTVRVSLNSDVCLSVTPFSGSDFALWSEHEYIVNIPSPEWEHEGRNAKREHLVRTSVGCSSQPDFPCRSGPGPVVQTSGRLWTGLFYLTFILYSCQQTTEENTPVQRYWVTAFHHYSVRVLTFIMRPHSHNYSRVSIINSKEEKLKPRN